MSEGKELRSYKVRVWPSGKFTDPSIEFEIQAEDPEDARAQVIALHGDTMRSIWNEEDANKPR